MIRVVTPTEQEWEEWAQDKPKQTWEEFNTRFTNIRNAEPFNFYGCVNAEGEWFDSSESFEIAVHWCCYSAGEFDLTNELEWMSTEGVRLGYSVIHSSMLKQMYEKGLIK